MIEFLLHNEKKTILKAPQKQSVLQYLREVCSKKGTKEGCGTGDCGACTVVLAERKNDNLNYYAVNSCLMQVTDLQAKQLISIEDLADAKGSLHPVQQALVDFHGSQCGFCTPGIVMSLFALYKSSHGCDERAIIHALGGNLCRCTGYLPIIKAALDLHNRALQEDHFDHQQQKTLSRLKAMQLAASHETDKGISFSPTTLKEVDLLLEQTRKPKLVSGATDLSLLPDSQLEKFTDFIHLGRVQLLKQVADKDQSLYLGCGLSVDEFSQAVKAYYPEIDKFLERFASLQVRKLGTLGGNLANASAIADLPVVLLALNAQLILRNQGQQRKMALDDFFIDYKITALQEKELLEAVILPKPKSNEFFRVYKLSKRFEDDISIVCAAFSLVLQKGKVLSVRLAFGGLSATTRRATLTEKTLLNQPFTKETIDLAAQTLALEFQPISDVRASNQYRLKCAINLLYRFFFQLQTPSQLAEVKDYA